MTLFIAGQVTCLECGTIDMRIKRASSKWPRAFVCVCGSRLTAAPVWFPVEDSKAIAAALSAEHFRDAKALIKRRSMH